MGIGQKAEAIVVIFVLAIVGFFLFPHLYSMYQTINTTGWSDLAKTVYTAIPYFVFVAIAIIAYLLFKGGNK